MTTFNLRNQRRLKRLMLKKMREEQIEIHVFDFPCIWVLVKMLGLNSLHYDSNEFQDFISIIDRQEFGRECRVNMDSVNYCHLIELCIKIYNEMNEVLQSELNKILDKAKAESEEKFIKSREFIEKMKSTMDIIKDKNVVGMSDDYDGDGVAIVFSNKN